MFNEFDLENQPACEYDHVDIHDGDDLQAARLGRFCGNERPEEMVTSGNVMFISFESDKSVQKRGFQASHTTGWIVSFSRKFQVGFKIINFGLNFLFKALKKSVFRR